MKRSLDRGHLIVLCLCVLWTIQGAHSSCWAVSLTTADRSRLTTILHQADSDLRNDVMPFWTRSTWDTKYGGFLTEVDRRGMPLPNSGKHSIMQARMIWTLSAAHRYGIRDRGYLALAKKAVRYLTTTMWDPKFQGFYMSVKNDGTPDDTRKFTYCQEFVVYGLAEYALVSGDRNALHWAEKTYDLIKQKAGDGALGFREDFDREWRPLPGSLSVIGVPSGKTLNTHMHMMEALTALAEASRSTYYKVELERVTDLLVRKAINLRYGCAMEPFDRNWNPTRDGKGRISTFYGHNVELASLFLDAYAVLGRPRENLRTTFFGLIDNAIKYGFDSRQGGLAVSGPYDSLVTASPDYADSVAAKDWWEQAEAMTAFTQAYEWSGERHYLKALSTQWDWIWRHQIDHQGGDWFTTVKWTTGEPLTLDKGAGGWKVCYHNGRSLMNVSMALRAILRKTPPQPSNAKVRHH